MDNFLELGNLVQILITAAVTYGGTFLFYKQRRRGLDIENESKQSDEWKKLYMESQEDSARKDKKIDELRTELHQLRTLYIEIQREVRLNSMFRCEKISCTKRFPPISPAASAVEPEESEK